MQTTRRRVVHIWRQKLCVKLNGRKITHARCKNSGNMSIFNHSMFRFCFIYLLQRRKRIESYHLQPFFPRDLSFPAFFIYSQSIEYELITGDHRTNQIAWNRIIFNKSLYPNPDRKSLYPNPDLTILYSNPDRKSLYPNPDLTILYPNPDRKSLYPNLKILYPNQKTRVSEWGQYQKL